MTKDDFTSASGSANISSLKVSPEEKPPERAPPEEKPPERAPPEEKPPERAPPEGKAQREFQSYWRDIAYRNVLKDNIFDTVEYLFPSIYEDIDKTITPKSLATDLLALDATSNLKSVKPDYIWEFGSLIPEYPKIIFSLEQQHTNHRDLKERIIRTYTRLRENNPNDCILTSVLCTGFNLKNGTILIDYRHAEFMHTFKIYNVLEVNENSLKNDSHPFAFVVLSSFYASKANEDPKLRFEYAKKLYERLDANKTLDNDRRYVYRKFVQDLFRLYDLRFSYPEVQRWIMTTTSLAGQLRQQASFKTFMITLNPFFEYFATDPRVREKFIMIGANVGVDQQTIDAEYDKWLKAQASPS
ncbi:MAG: hypothetical protein LBE49_06945 [Deltaproteobacteria bacterium]|jgi:hypothetical protein|nr:hypothetical protein [Deltaproteobacteria bacterium]